jgi:WD40 repeat protein
MAIIKPKVLATLLLLVSVCFGSVAAVADRALAGEQATGQENQGLKQLSQERPRVRTDTQQLGRTDLYGDPLPPGALVRMGTVQLRHVPGGVNSAFSPDGKILATADGNAPRLWDMGSGKLLRQVKENHEWWGPVLFSPDGKLLASACNESLYLLDTATGKPVCRIPGMDRVLAFSPDNQLVAAATTRRENRQGTVYLCHASTGQLAFELRGQERFIYTAVFTSDGRTLITLAPSQAAGFDKIVCYWDVATRTLRKTVVIHLPPVRRSFSACLSPDGHTMALAYSSGMEPVSLWDTDTGKKKGTLQGDGTVAKHLAFTQDSRTLATAWCAADGTQGTVSLWDATTGKRLRRFSISARAWDNSLQFSPDGLTSTVRGHPEGPLREGLEPVRGRRGGNSPVAACQW